MPVGERGGDQCRCENQRLGMEAKETVEVEAVSCIAGHGVGGQPVFVEPHIEQNDAEKTCQVENILLYGDRLVEGGGGNSQRCSRIGEGEKEAGEEEIERCAQGEKQTD